MRDRGLLILVLLLASAIAIGVLNMCVRVRYPRAEYTYNSVVLPWGDILYYPKYASITLPCKVSGEIILDCRVTGKYTIKIFVCYNETYVEFKVVDGVLMFEGVHKYSFETYVSEKPTSIILYVEYFRGGKIFFYTAKLFSN